MTFALWLGLLALPAAAVVSLALPRAARVLAGAGFLAAVGGMAAVAREAVNGRVFGSRGFEADLWRAGLALVVLVVCATAVARGGSDDPYRWVLLIATAAAGVASLLVADIFSFAAFLVASTLAFTALSVASGSRAGLWVSARFAASDLAAVVGLVLIAADGMRVPPAARGAGALALLVAALVRGGVFPGSRRLEAVTGEDAVISAAALGVMRAQAIALSAWVSLSGSEWRTAMAIAAALLAAGAAHRAIREASVAAAGTAQFAMVVAAFGLGGSAVVRGGVLLAVGMFLAAVFVVSGRAHGWASPTIGAAPLGATLPGAALVATAAFTRALDDRVLFAAALPLAAALVWLAQAGVSGMRARGEMQSPVRDAWLAAPALAVAAIAVVPGAALAGLATAAVAAGARRLVVAPSASIGDELGIAFVIAALGVAAAAIPRPREGARPTPASRVHLPAAPDPSAVRAVAVFVVLAVGWLVVLFGLGVRRGFL